jgi:helix-turn-helix protein
MGYDAARKGMTKPSPPPEAVLIRLAREAARIKAPAAAKSAGVSVARWSQIETGYETRLGRYKPVRAPEGTLAHMAHAVGVGPERLEEAGRPDAAMVLREIQRQQLDPLTPDERQTLSDFREAVGPGPDDDDPLSPEDHKALDDYRAFILGRAAERRRLEAEEKHANGGKTA